MWWPGGWWPTDRSGHNGAMSDLDTLQGTDQGLDPSLADPMLEDGDHERFSHYVRKDRILPSAVDGTPVIALCGKKWVPTRDPKRFPVCPECKEIYAKLKGDG